MSAVALNARHTAGYEARLARTESALRAAARQHTGAIVQASSLGAEDMVITDLIARLALPIDVATLDTGVLHDETLALMLTMRAHYGITLERFEPPTEAVVRFVERHGRHAMFESIDLRKACCRVRKMEPLDRMLAGRSAWITGLRREQSMHRADVPLEELDGQGRYKVSPLAEWSWQDVWHYISSNNVPYNALHDQFFPSIGCAPCTRAVAQGEDLRAGRWWWEDDTTKECGLHSRQRPIQAEKVSA